MWIKRASHTARRPWAGAWSNGRLAFRKKLLLGIALGGVLVTILCLGSVYQGMVLVKSGRSMELSDWLGGLAQTRLGVVPNYLGSLRASPERLEIDIGFEHQQRLAFTRERALAEGQLFSVPDDWVPATIRHRGEKYRVQLRLKGDLSDHWRRPDQWSYKVKVKGDATILGMKRFALQDPRTRKHMNEWVVQRMLRHLGLIALRYEFVDLTINGVHQPVYALEENFDKRLIENNQRREGPILRYDQWFYWKHDPGLAPELAGASVGAYQEEEMAGGELGPVLETARSLLELYRRGDLAASEVFDAELMARFFALIELIGYDHAAGIDNLKFYYNPITSRLEPIGYDFNRILPLAETGLMSSRLLPAAVESDLQDWRRGLFADPVFLERYVAAVERVSEEAWLDAFFESIEEDFDRNLAILHRSNPWYEFTGRDLLEENQGTLRAFLRPEKSLQVYLDSYSQAERRLTVRLSNVHTLPTVILSLELASGTVLQPTRASVVEGYAENEPLRYSDVAFDVPQDAALDLPLEIEGMGLRHRFPGASDERLAEVHGWRAVAEGFQPEGGRRASDLSRFDFVDLDEARATIRLLPGRWSLRETLVLPAGYEVLAGGGVELDLQVGAALISYSPLTWSGSDEAPVRLFSTDGSGQGLVVMAGGRASSLQWVEFSDLDAPALSGWSQTGAVTFYESPVDLVDCRFAGARSEDALNLVRSRFLLRRCSFVEASSDAFDADFCSGRVEDTVFLRSGNDAFDVSGSRVEVLDTRMEGCGDKGISVGEASRIQLRGCFVSGAEIALACKDRSEVLASGLVIAGCRVGLAVFEKKSEFGPAHVTIQGLSLEGAERPYLVEEGSVLSIDGRRVAPIEGKVEELLYGAQFGIRSR